MPESGNGGNTSLTPPKKEMSMEMRLLVAFLLMGAVMLVTQLWFKPPETPAVKRTEQSAPVPKAGEPPLPAATPAPATTAEAAPKAPVAGATPPRVEPPFIIDTDQFRVVFSNQGATVRSWQLKNHRGNDGKPLELSNPTSGMPFPFSLQFPNQKPATDVNWAWFKQTADADGLGVTYEYSDGHTLVVKSFKFDKASYLSRVKTSVTTDGKPVPHMIAWRGGFGDFTLDTPGVNQRTLFFDVTTNELKEKTANDAKNGPATFSGVFSFAGIADTYFAAVFLPQNPVEMEVVTFADWVQHLPMSASAGKSEAEKTAAKAAAKPEGFVGVALSAKTENAFELFVGPKDLDLLARINPKLVNTVDFGMLSFLARPLFLAVNWINDRMVHNYGWAIVLVTIVINFVLFPLKLSSMKSMRKMQALKPQIDAINAKYKNLKITDPRKGEQNQEVMGLYKQHGVNPMGGCVPMLLQIPFFFAFYKVFTVSVEMRGAPWLWVTDLSQPETLAIKILPIAMIASQFYMQKMTPQPNQDPAQARMMLFMPLIFGYMFYWFPSGLVLYYLTSNLVSMGQQWFFNRMGTAKEAALSVESPKKRNGRK